MKVAFAFAVLAAMLASACGSDDSAAPPTTTSGGSSLSADDVEKAFRTEVAGGGVVNLDDTSPKSIDCVKGDGDQVWRC
ncbi:MAG: hypothetical protein EHM63_02720, partial [Actinobacteria bacterium]